MKRSIVSVLRIFLFVYIFVFIGLAYLFLVLDKRAYHNFIIETVTTEVQVSLYSLNMAIDSSADVQLFNILGSITKTNNVVTSFITDNNLKVVMGDNSALNKIKKISDTSYKKALSQKDPLLQKISSDDNIYLYSAPLSENLTIFTVFSTQAELNMIENLRLIYFIGAIFLSGLFTLGLYFLLNKFLLKPLQQTKIKLEQGKLDEVKDSNENEIIGIFLEEIKNLKKNINLLSADVMSLGNILSHYHRKYENNLSAFIVLNSVSNMLYAEDKTGKILKNNFVPKSNIVEALIIAELMKTIEKSYETPNKEIIETIGDIEFSVITLFENQSIAATIIAAAK
jgi:hypothetical protein